MEFCDLGSLDTAISDGRFYSLVQFPLLSCFSPLNTCFVSREVDLVQSKIIKLSLYLTLAVHAVAPQSGHMHAAGACGARMGWAALYKGMIQP
jgi:hypothetical protein